MTKIVILICYYGHFPWYFSYFLHSCKFNHSIDFMIYSDNHYQGWLPQNVSIIRMKLAELQSIATKKLGFEVSIDAPYKLCDFKPMYGLLFEEFIQDYDFWGQSDIDLIYGDLRAFFSDKFLRKYDFISVRHDYTSGCFALYKNSFLMNNLFKRSKDYKLIYSSPVHFCFDECNFLHDELTKGRSIFELESEIESFTHVILNSNSRHEIRAHFDFLLMDGVPGRLKFNNGKIIYKNKYEVVLYHLYWFKKICSPGEPKVSNSYRISKRKIYSF